MNKIYFIDESLDMMGGVERIINTLSNDLVKKYDVELISLYKSNNETYFKYDDNIKINYIYKKSNLISKKYKKNKPLYYFIRLLEKANEFITIKLGAKKYAKKVTNKDIVIFGRVPTALEFLPYINAKKIIVREAMHLEYHKNKSKIKKYFPEKVDLFILSSDENMKSYKEFLGDAVKMIKIYNPLSITPKVINNVDVKNVISIGRYDTHKGYDYLIRAFKIVSEKYPDWKLRIVGDGYYKPKMEELISDLNLNDNVLLVPATKDVVKELNKAYIYVMASRFEGYANALVEAMACGLSCISYDWLMGVDEIIKHNENGLIVNLTDRYRYFKTLDIIDEDINILADMIIKTIEDKNMREKFKNEAPKIVNSRKKDKIIEKWLKIVCEENYEEKNKN